MKAIESKVKQPDAGGKWELQKSSKDEIKTVSY